jgi:hypothetical protein
MSAYTTGISKVVATDNSQRKTTYYTLNGMQLSEPRKGINIVKYADGRVEKIIVK